MKSIISKRNTNLFKKQFKVGFECEFVLDKSKISYRDMRKTMRSIHKNIVIGGDGSIYWDDEDDVRYEHDENYNGEGYDGVEIKTPPLIPYSSLLLLHQVFGFIDKYGFTNQSCGLHASFSPISDKAYYKVDPLKIFNNPLWDKIKRDFDREDNEYCERNPFNRGKKKKKQTPLQKWYDAINGCYDYDYNYYGDGYDGHNSDVNFENYDLRRNKASRIEIRCMGNKDYHKNFPKVAKYTHQIITALKQGYNVNFR